MSSQRHRPILLAIAAMGLLIACGQPPSGGAEIEPTPATDDAPEPDGKEAPPSPSLKDLGPNGRRVSLIVLPGDASVEIEGFTARRRDGIIELVGKVGDTRRLRVFKGTQQLEREVTIKEDGASPALLDLSTRPAALGGYPEETKDSGPAKAPAVLLPEEFE